MSTPKDSPPEKTNAADNNDTPSPRNGILKTGLPAKVNTNPNWQTPTSEGSASGLDSSAKKQVRHSIVSIDSAVDVSELEKSMSTRVRCQKKLSVYLHTHVVLIIVCSLAILDAVCVIGQLICDILIMKEKLEYLENVDEKLTEELLGLNMTQLNKTLHNRWNLHAILQVLQGIDTHGYLQDTGTSAVSHTGASRLLNSTESEFSYPMSRDREGLNSVHRKRRAAEVKVPGHEAEHGVLYEMTHTFHVASMVILSLLLLETLLKVIAMGKKLKHHKLEVFDALVVTISWCLDVGFYEGIWAHPGSEAATFIMYLLPWRVIRIVNSFVLVIQEKEHVHLKIVKQRLRQSIKKSKEVLEKASAYRHEVKALAGLSRKLGATETEISSCSPSGKAGRRGSVQSVLERAASLTFISTMSSFGSIPSLFDMTDSSEDEEDQEQRTGHNDLEREVSYDPTMKSLNSATLELDSGVKSQREEDQERRVYQDRRSRGRGRRRNMSENEDVSSEKSDVERSNSNSSSSVPPEYEEAVVVTSDISTRL